MRTVKEIKNEMTAAFMADTNIRAKYDPDNNWTSSTLFDDIFASASLESIIFYTIAVCAWGLEFLFSKHIDEVLGCETKMRIGTKEWWRQLCFNFQLGYTLDFDTLSNTYKYSTIDDDAKIIKYVDVKETTNGLVMIVNEADIDGSPVKMDTVDLTNRNAFEQYIRKVKVAGVPLIWNSYTPDLLRMSLTVVIDPLVVNASGEFISNGDKPVNLAIAEYLQNIPFGSGVLNKTQIIDAIQKATGVIDVYPTVTGWLEVSTEYLPSFTSVSGQNITAYGGSFKLDSLTINYISNV
jgi:hypothetical protein